MKTTRSLIAAVLTLAFVAAPLAGFAEDKKPAAKPYPLEKCIVSDEIKLCCKSCQKDFNKNPAKYLKKIEGDTKPDKK
jgi:hypothetical protein